MSNASVSGLRSGGSASVAGGTINVGAASSDVTSELNAVQNDNGVNGNLFVAGERRLWAPTLLIQRDSPTLTSEDPSRTIERGTINQELKQKLINPLQLVEVITKENPTDPTKPYTNVQFTEEYERINSLILAKDNQGKPKTNGLHIISMEKESESKTRPINIKEIFAKAISPETKPNLLAWQSDKAIDTKIEYIGYGKSSESENVIDIGNTQGSGTTQTDSKVTILGFNKNANPSAGKTSSLSAFATNNQTVGTLRVATNQTLADIASQYGTTVEDLVKVNNLPSADIDITGTNLVVPSDLSTVGLYDSEIGETPSIIAKRYGISVGWLMDLNGLTDPEQVFTSSRQLQIPGLRPIGSTILPPAKPLAAELEFADYGAYTSFEVTYYIEGSLTPIFARNFANAFR
jgi:LysM repeat protein